MKKYNLSEISINNKGYYGIGASSCKFSNELPQYLRITDIDDSGNIPNILPTSIDVNVYPDYYKYFLHKNDIVFARTGNSTGRNYFFDGESNTIVFAGFLIKFSINPNLIVPKYVKYYCQSNSYYEQIKSFVTGSTRNNINAEQYANLLIPFIDPIEQQHIVNILGSIDEKIENLTQFNRKLNYLIQLVYLNLINKTKSNTYAKISDYCSCVLGGTPSREKNEYWNGNINWINSGEINNFRIIKPSEKISELGLKRSTTTLIPKNSVMLAITGATLGQVSLSCIDTCTNQSVVSILECEKVKSFFVYPMIKNKIKDIINLQTGGAQQHINKRNIENFQFILPYDDEMMLYYKIVSPIFNNITGNCFLIEKLNELKQLYLKKFFG